MAHWRHPGLRVSPGPTPKGQRGAGAGAGAGAGRGAGTFSTLEMASLAGFEQLNATKRATAPAGAAAAAAVARHLGTFSRMYCFKDCRDTGKAGPGLGTRDLGSRTTRDSAGLVAVQANRKKMARKPATARRCRCRVRRCPRRCRRQRSLCRRHI